MKYLKSKKGKVSTSVITSIIVGIVGIVVFFTLLSTLVPEAQTAGDGLNVSNICIDAGGYYNKTLADCTVSASNPTLIATGDPIPFSTLFASGGVIFLVIMATVVMLVIRSTLKKYRGYYF